jgi:23S rRNA pseudouridine1911/1915/1917 synthase
LFTGRTHQIRVHMKNAGHPIACDELYGDGQPVLVSALKKKYNLSKSEELERPILGRLGLHAAELSFTDPDNVKRHFQAAMPKDMRALLSQLEKTRQR